MTTPDPNNPMRVHKRKGRMWWKVLLAIVLLIALLIVFAPTLASTGPGKDLVFAQINSRIPGKLSAESLSVGWFSGAKLQKLEYKDDKNTSLVAVDGVDTGVTVMDILRGNVIDLEKVAVTGGRDPNHPDVIVAVNLSGKVDLGQKIITFTKESDVSATDQKSGKANIVKFPAGAVIAYGGGSNDFHAACTYHLPLLQAFIADKLPKDTVLDGTYTVDLHVTGPFTKTGLKVDQTKIGEGRIYMEGFDIGEAQIPVAVENGIVTITPTDLPFKTGGRIRVRGKIDLNLSPPVFKIDTPDDPNEPFIKDMELNHKIAAGKLRFFPLLWGSVDQEGNMGQMSGKVNIRLDHVFMPCDAEGMKVNGLVKGALSVHDLQTDAPFLNQIGQLLGPMMNLGALSKGGNPLAVKGGKIDDVAFEMKDGKVTYNNLRLGSAGANITFSGSVALNNAITMNMQVGMPGVNLPIPIAIKGTTSKPEMVLEGKLPSISDLNTIGKDLEKNAPNMLEGLLKKKK